MNPEDEIPDLSWEDETKRYHLANIIQPFFPDVDMEQLIEQLIYHSKTASDLESFRLLNLKVSQLSNAEALAKGLLANGIPAKFNRIGQSGEVIINFNSEHGFNTRGGGLQYKERCEGIGREMQKLADSEAKKTHSAAAQTRMNQIETELKAVKDEPKDLKKGQDPRKTLGKGEGQGMSAAAHTQVGANAVSTVRKRAQQIEAELNKEPKPAGKGGSKPRK